MKNDIEFKKMIGNRMNNDDGFTYVYGKAKGGYNRKSRATKANRISVRNDKRSVKAKALKREFKDNDYV
jgi:hypothetical protein